MAFYEDFADSINTDTPGYVTATVGGVGVGAIFDAAYATTFDLSAGVKPAIHCAHASVPGVEQGTAVTVNAVNYTVAEVQPDGTGLVLLVLERV